MSTQLRIPRSWLSRGTKSVLTWSVLTDAVQTATVVIVGSVVLSCAPFNMERKRLEDGSYQLKCDATLAACLRYAEEQCPNYGYDVVQATEDKKRHGPSLVEKEYFHSQAQIRCRRAQPLIGGAEESPAPVSAASAESQSMPSRQNCVPGATQACVGPGGCQGGQVCASSGMAFGSCDCGPSSVPARSQPPAAGATNAGSVAPVGDQQLPAPPPVSGSPSAPPPTAPAAPAPSNPTAPAPTAPMPSPPAPH